MLLLISDFLDLGEKPSLEKLCGENTSGENPSNFSRGENPSASFATGGERPSPFLGGEKPAICNKWIPNKCNNVCMIKSHVISVRSATICVICKCNVTIVEITDMN